MAALTIGRLADAAGVNVETVRYYERRGLLPEPPRTASGYRQYGDDHVWRLDLIRRAKTLGFTLTEIGALLAGGGGPRTVEAVLAAAADRLDALDREIGELVAARERLRLLVEVCRAGDGEDCLALDPCKVVHRGA